MDSIGKNNDAANQRAIWPVHGSPTALARGGKDCKFNLWALQFFS